MFRRQNVTTAFICAGLCALFAAVSWMAVRGKSATMDEPAHTIVGWLNLYRHDYRLSPDVPPLWEKWIALPMGANAIHFGANEALYRNIEIRADMTAWSIRTLYQVPGNDGIKLVSEARAMALVWGVALAALIGRWTWELAAKHPAGRAAAAIAATLLFTLDPNFLGHSALAKNDVAATAAYLAAAYAIWRAGLRLTWSAAFAVMVLTAVAVGVKPSGMLLGPIIIGLFTFRAFSKEPWFILRRPVTSRAGKLAAAGGLALATLVFTYCTIWASYNFRFDPGPDGMRLQAARFVEFMRYSQVFGQVHRPPTPAELAAWSPPWSTRTIIWAQDHHLLPQAWTSGFLMVQYGANERLSYLNGLFYNGGKWYYFPLAAMYKAPLATLIAVVAAGAWAARAWRPRNFEGRWSAIVLVTPAAAYALVMISSNVNIGLRHAFPVYPFVFIGVGLAAGRAWAAGPVKPLAMNVTRGLVLLLALGLAVESASAYPNYINFFGIACGGRTAGYALLSDSNLDWGQDLPLLAQWQRKHPDTPLYLSYFGQCDPAAYGIRYYNLSDSYAFGPPPVFPSGPGVIAISATKLRIFNSSDPPPIWFGLVKHRQPEAILGGTIFIYRIGHAE